MKLGASFSISYYLCVFLSCLVSYSSVAGRDTISTDTAASGELQAADCDRSLIDFSKVPTNECFSNLCGSKIMDGLFSLEEIERLHTIVRKGMAQRVSVGGPTILDINTGYIRDSKGLENLFLRESDIYSSEDFSHYGSIIKKLKDTVANTFGISQLYFTAPTFITRLNGDIKWSPQGVHDEYWHVHADMNNTAHYHYSGLLYMSTYGDDFKGGRLGFVNPNSVDKFVPQQPGTDVGYNMDHEDVNLIVEPVVGRAVVFTSGPENPHFVERVTAGERFVLSFWFTCDPAKEFQIFLDGKAHTTFSHRIKAAQKNKSNVKQRKSEL